MSILSANELNRDFLNSFARNVLAKLKNLKISDFKEKFSEAVKENFTVSDDLKIHYDNKVYKLNFVIYDETKFFIPYGKPLLGSPIFEFNEFELLKMEPFFIKSTSNNPYFIEKNGEINLILVLRTVYHIDSNHIFEIPIGFKKSDLKEDLLSALLKAEVEK